MPTFAHIAGFNVDDHIDGINVWSALSYDLPSPRINILAHHDAGTPYMAYINENYKLISGTTSEGIYDGWLSQPINPFEQNNIFGDNYSDMILSSNVGKALSKYSKSSKNQSQNTIEASEEIISAEEIDEIRSKAQIMCNEFSPPAIDSTAHCNPMVSPCLFDIQNDPCETTNLALQFPNVVSKLKAKLELYGRTAKPMRNKPSDPRSDPINFGGIWTWWYDELKMNETTLNSGEILIFILRFALVCTYLYLHFHFRAFKCVYSNKIRFLKHEVSATAKRLQNVNK